MSSENDEDYLIVGAIDFGTSFSGYAFSSRIEFKRNPINVSASEMLSGNFQSLKTPTCILFKPDMTFHSFGYQAESKYSELASDPSKEYRKWYFFQRFKMKLYKTQKFKNLMITGENGKEMLAIKVFSSSISYLKDKVIEQCKNQMCGIGEEDIRWIITVPTMWSEAAKSFMRKASEMAGILPQKLCIVLEPEAAAVFVRHVPIHRKTTGEIGDSFQMFEKGSKYIVCDAGGGTVDITVHEVDGDGKIKELKIAAGKKSGGTKVDEAFLSFLEMQIVGHSLKKYIKDEAYDFMEICREFELKKRHANESDFITLRIPFSLRSIIDSSSTKSKLTQKFWKKDGSEKENKNDSVIWYNDKVKIKKDIVKGFFGKSVGKICKLLEDTLKATKADYILMVGGYSESEILQETIKHAFPSTRIIIPQEAGLSVLKGAVILGHDPLLIKERICKNTFGIACSAPFKEGTDPEEYKFWKDGMWRCAHVFQKHVTVGETVVVGEYQTEKILEKYSDSEDLHIPIISSQNEDPKYVTDKGCSQIGVLNLKISDGRQLGRSKIKVEMSFSGTEIQAKATCMATGAVDVVFLDHSI